MVGGSTQNRTVCTKKDSEIRIEGYGPYETGVYGRVEWSSC